MVAGSGTDNLQLWAGDTAVLNSGHGNAEISRTGGSGNSTVRFGPGISAASLTASAIVDSSGNAALSIASGATAVTLDGALSGSAYQYNFNGAGNLTLAQFLAAVNVSTSSVTGALGNVVLEGTATTAVSGGSGNDTIYAAAAGDTIVAGAGNQSLLALGIGDLVTGGVGQDSLTGLGTNDTLVAGSTANTLVGGTGATVTFVINNASDVIQLQSSPGADTVSSSVSYSLPTNLNCLLLTGTSSIKGTANAGADTLISNSGALDTLAGGAGADLFVVNSSTDIVSVGATHGVDTIQSSVSYTDAVNVANLILTGTAALSGTGTTTASQITANGGADTLTAGAAVTTLIGGTGNDTFIINLATDVVQDSATTTTKRPFKFRKLHVADQYQPIDIDRDKQPGGNSQHRERHFVGQQRH